jgi:hypothetical protein
MIKWSLRRATDKFERDWNYDCRMRVVVGRTPMMFDYGPAPAPADAAVRTA